MGNWKALLMVALAIVACSFSAYLVLYLIDSFWVGFVLYIFCSGIIAIVTVVPGLKDCVWDEIRGG